MEYTYVFPESFKSECIKYAKAMNQKRFVEPLNRSYIKAGVVGGYAYYENVAGCFWNSRTVDLEIICTETDGDLFRSNQYSLREIFNKALLPKETGLICDEVLFIDKESVIDLPDESDPTLETLRPIILELINRGKPVQALDRLHTFTYRFLKGLCHDSGVQTQKKNGDNLPLHSLMGNLCNYYEENHLIESGFSIRALKQSISLLDSFNEVRNNKSFAHDNDVLNAHESLFVAEIISSVLNFINAIKPEHPDWRW